LSARTAAPPSGDLELIRRVIEGDPDGHRAFIERIDPIVGRCLSNARIGAPPWVAEMEEDLRQQFELMLIDHDCRVLRSFGGRATLTTWIYVVATRFFRHQLRRIRSERERFTLAVSLSELPDPTESVETAHIRRTEVGQVKQAVAGLEERDRLLLALTYEQELTAEEIGRLLGLKAAGVRMRKKRLLARLAERLLGRTE
jgi:RNA polymerase sigma factor (sigma-70 family)